MKKAFFALIAVLIISVFVFSACSGGQKATPSPSFIGDKYSPPHNKPGPAAEKLTFKAYYVDQAVADLRADNMDIYFFGLKITAAKELEKRSEIRAYRAPASTVSIILNPAPAPKGKLNPFSLPEVRKAMNYLIDRQFIVQEIYGGLAVPMISLVSPLDYDFPMVSPAIKDSGINYDFEYAKILVKEAMTKAGAQLIDGNWHYRDQLIRLKFIIRVEDERREVGDFIRLALEKTGFQVESVYKTFSAAVFTVYTSDPQTFEWHLYTEGWGRGGAEKYDFATVNQMAAPWMGNMPGWQIVGFWQYQSQELDKLGKKLFTGDFSNKEERDQIYREMVKMSLDDSIRVWVATIYNTFPAKEGLMGITEDAVVGPKGILTLREAYLPGKDILRVGNLWVWTERTVWNPIGGFEDVYSVDIWKNIYDPPIIRHPFTGVPMPFRASYEIETAGPQGRISVPSDAVLWDAKNNTWQKVAVNTKSKSRVVFDYSKYFQSAWHSGRKISMADVIYGIYQNFEMTYDPDKKQIEFVLASVQKPLLDTIVGLKVLDENRLEIYLDFWHFEESYIASYASLSSLPLPWEIMAAMDNLVFEDKTAAYSKTTAVKYNVPWLSLVMSRDAAMVAKTIREFSDQNYLPENIFSIVKNQPQTGYQQITDWFDKYSHLIISQGPFKLVRYDPPAQYAELQAFRDPDYPFKPGDWYYENNNKQ